MYKRQLHEYVTGKARRAATIGEDVQLGALEYVVTHVKRVLEEAEVAFRGPKDVDDDDPAAPATQASASLKRRQRYRIPPEDRDVVRGYDWGAADGRRDMGGFFECLRLDAAILDNAAAEAASVAEQARASDGDDFIFGDQLTSLVGVLRLACAERPHYAGCVRAWHNMGTKFPRAFGRGNDARRPTWGLELCCWLLHPGVVLDGLVKKVRCIVLASGTLSPVEKTERELGVEFSRRMKLSLIHI